MSDQRTLDLAAVAERWRCSPKTVRRRINQGQLIAARVARGRWVIRLEDVEACERAMAAQPREVGVLPAPVAQPIQPGRRPVPSRRGSPDGSLSRIVHTITKTAA